MLFGYAARPDSPQSRRSSRRLRAQGLLATLVVSAAACDPSQSPPHDLAEQATRELGIPIFLWAYPNDPCTVHQLTAFWDEYRALNGRDREAFRNRLKTRYDAVILNMAENVGRREEHLTEVRYLRRDCRDRPPETGAYVFPYHCHDLPSGSRSYRRVVSAPDHAPVVRLVRGLQLEITPELADDVSTSRALVTRRGNVFRALPESSASSVPDLSALVSSSVLREGSLSRATPVLCAPIVHLSDLF